VADREAEQRLLSAICGGQGMLLARSRNPDLAADLLQDVMIEALCALRGATQGAGKTIFICDCDCQESAERHYRGAVRRRSRWSFRQPADLFPKRMQWRRWSGNDWP